MLRIATCLVAASLVAGSIAPASAQTTETKPSRMKLTMQKLKEIKQAGLLVTTQRSFDVFKYYAKDWFDYITRW